MLLKGTSHRIIEVRGEKDCYFEKAVLYLRPEFSERSSLDIKSEAISYASQLSDNEQSEDLKSKKLLKLLLEIMKILLTCALTLAAVLIFMK